MLTIMDRNVHNGAGFICDKRTNVKAFCIIFSANNIETMVKSFKAIKKAESGEPRSGKGARSATMQSVVQRPKPHVGEMIIYGLLILLLMAGTYWRNRVWNSGVELWTDCVKKSPNKARPHNNLGEVYFNQGRRLEATDHFQEALRIDPNYAEAHYNVGTVFFHQGKYQEAINQYKEALRINPNYAKAHNNLGTVFFNQDKYQEAINQYKEALRINPNFAEAHYNLGNAYLMIGNHSLALEEYEILKTMNQGLAKALYQEIK
jgi:tetratricopeptide (TPR) repeat protein